MFLNNIVKIEVARASDVVGAFCQETLSECSVDSSIKWSELDIKVPAKMTVEDEIRDKQVVKVTNIVFHGCPGQYPTYPTCLRLTLRNGKQMLVGDGRRPHIVGLCKTNHPDNVADSQLAEYTVKRVCSNQPLIILA